MNRLRLIFIIALREFREQTRSRAFRLGTFMTLLLVVAAVVFPALASQRDTKAFYRVGVLEPASTQLTDAIAQAGPALDAEILVVPETSMETGESDLRTDTVTLLVVPGKELVSRVAPDPSVADSASRLRSALSETLRLYAGLDEAGLNPQSASNVINHRPLAERGLEVAPHRNSKNASASGSGMILLFVFLTLYGAFVLNSVIEEKTSRVVEILLATVRPIDLLSGKVLGIGMVGTIQGLALVVATFLARSLTPGGSGNSLTPTVLGYTLLWFAIGFAMFSWLYACAGALVSRSVDAQNLVFPLQLPLLGSYLVGLYAANSGPHPVVTVMSMIPFTAPMTMLERMSAEEAPLWQIGVSIGVCLLTTLLTMRLAVTIFAGGILRSGQRVKLRDAWRWY